MQPRVCAAPQLGDSLGIALNLGCLGCLGIVLGLSTELSPPPPVVFQVLLAETERWERLDEGAPQWNRQKVEESKLQGAREQQRKSYYWQRAEWNARTASDT